MSTAKVLGRYRDDLVAEGFTREEALDLVGHVAPMDTADLDGTEPSQGEPLQVMVIGGSFEEADQWIRPMRAACGDGVRFVKCAGSSPPYGMAGPMVLVELPSADRRPAEVRQAWREAVHLANLRFHGA